VTLVHRRNGFRAAAILQERVRQHAVITLALEAILIEIVGSSRVEGVKIQHAKSAVTSEIPCDGVFIFVGSAADTGFLKGLVAMNDDGRIVTDEHMVTSWAGVFASGDCRQRPLYQVVTACADGAIAANAAGKYLERET
jgi:thioredoxin reductase (NADPH)